MSGLPPVALLGSLPPIRGLSAYCLELTRALVKYRPVEFISFKAIYPAFLYPGGDLRDDPTFPSISDSGLKVRRRLTWCNPLTWIAEGVSARTALLHAQWWSLPLFPIYLVICAAFKMRRKPVIFTVHNVLPHEPSNAYRLASTVLFRFADHFIVHTEAGKRQLVSHYGIPWHAISVIPHGPLDFFVRPGADRTALRQSMGFSEDDRIILMFGAIRAYKGVDTALEAMAKVISENTRVRLLIAGKLWDDWHPYREIIDRTGISSHVTAHLEYIPSGDVHKYFEVADLAIFPYRKFDSQSGAAATALSFGKPMVVSNVGGLPEMVDDPRYNVRPDDPDALAAAILRSLNESGRAVSVTEAGKRMTVSWSEIAERTVAVYERLIAAGGK